MMSLSLYDYQAKASRYRKGLTYLRNRATTNQNQTLHSQKLRKVHKHKINGNQPIKKIKEQKRKTFLEKDTCTYMFIAALFTTPKTCKQPKCPSTDEWIKKMWYIYTMEYYSAIKKNKIMLFVATWMELETLILNEVSQKEKDKYHMISHIWNLTCGTNELFHGIEYHGLENRLVVAKGEGVGVR